MTFREYLAGIIDAPIAALHTLEGMSRDSIAEKIGTGDIDTALRDADDLARLRTASQSFIIAKKEGVDSRVFRDVYPAVREAFMRYHESEGFAIDVEEDTPGMLRVCMSKQETTITGGVHLDSNPEDDLESIVVALRVVPPAGDDDLVIRRRSYPT